MLKIDKIYKTMDCVVAPYRPHSSALRYFQGKDLLGQKAPSRSYPDLQLQLGYLLLYTFPGWINE
jgi:hypothetical protein